MANKPPPPLKPKPKPKPKLTVYVKPPTFKQKVMQGRQSTNVIDTRKYYPGYHRIGVNGYFTYNTFFHLAANVGTNIANALTSKGLPVSALLTRNKDTANSQYGFEVVIYVENSVGTAMASAKVTNALANTIAYPNSVRIMNAFNYD
jgi:hypothetical protein